MAAKSFIEVLEDQIRNDLRKEIEAEVRRELTGGDERDPALAGEVDPAASAAARIESWLVSRLGKAIFDRSPQARRAYQPGPGSRPRRDRAAETSPPSPRAEEPSSNDVRVCCRTIEQLAALELLKRHAGAKVPDSFSEAELKAIWRKAALKTHPDRFAQSDALTQARANALFAALAEAHERLAELFEDTNG